MARILDRAHEVADLLSDAGAQVEHGVDGGVDLDHKRAQGRGELEAIGAAGEGKARVWLGLGLLAKGGAHNAAHHNPALAAGQHAGLLDACDHTNRVELGDQGRVAVGVGVGAPGHEQHMAPILEGSLGGGQVLVVQGKADHSMRKDHGALKGDQWQCLWGNGRLDCALVRLAHGGTP